MTASNNTFPYFKQNQILRHTDLNQLVSYIQDQNNLVRVLMIGSGILNGFTVVEDIVANTVAISDGYGLSSDGYFFQMEQYVATHFKKTTINQDAFKCNLANPENRCNTEGEFVYDIYELKSEPTENEPSLSGYTPINFADSEDSVFKDFNEFYKDSVLVLLWCTKTENRRLCINDCDEEGADAKVSIRKILIRRGNIGCTDDSTSSNGTPTEVLPPFLPRLGYVETENETGEIVPKIDLSTIVNFEHLRTGYLAVFDLAKASIEAAYKKLTIDVSANLAMCEQILQDTNNCNAQYCFDYLQDLVLAYLEYEAAQCSAGFGSVQDKPDFCAHPGYIMLGSQKSGFEKCRNTAILSNFQKGDPSDVYRVGFYLKKLDLLSKSDTLDFDNLNEEKPIQITPSSRKNGWLSERAIPFYYRANQMGLRENWRYEWRQIREKRLYLRIPAYHAATEAYPPFQNHLLYDMNGYDFFRIEGHLDKKVEEVVDRLKELRRCHNLAFDIQCVKFGQQTSEIAELEKFGNKVDFGDLEMDYFEAKLDLICALEKLGQIGNPLRVFFNGNTDNLRTFYERYTDFLEIFNRINENDNSIHSELIRIEGSDCHFPIFERLIQSIDERLRTYLLPNFITKHSGLEHQAGVPKGGTFIIVYEKVFDLETERLICVVKADFALPYYCCGNNAGSTPQKPEPFIMIPHKTYCYKDNTDYEIFTYPSDGTLLVNPTGNHYDPDSKCFNPSKVEEALFDEETGRLIITFNYWSGGQNITKEIKIFRVIANFEIAQLEENDDDLVYYQITNLTTPLNDDVLLDWKTTEGYTIDPETLQFAVPVADRRDTVTVRLVADLNGCKDIVEHMVTMCNVVADFTYCKIETVGEYDIRFEFNDLSQPVHNVETSWEVSDDLTIENDVLLLRNDSEIEQFEVTLNASNNHCSDSKKRTVGNFSAHYIEENFDFTKYADGNVIGYHFEFKQQQEGENPLWKWTIGEDEQNQDGNTLIVDFTYADYSNITSFQLEFRVEDGEGNCAKKIDIINIPPIPEIPQEENGKEAERRDELLNKRRGELSTKLTEVGQKDKLNSLKTFRAVVIFQALPYDDELVNRQFKKVIAKLTTQFGQANGTRDEQYEQLAAISIVDYLHKQLALGNGDISEEALSILKNAIADLSKDGFQLSYLKECLKFEELKEVLDKKVIDKTEAIFKDFLSE